VVAAGTIALAAAAAALSAIPAATAAAAAAGAAAVRGDRPGGFWYGTDSRTITITGSEPYKEPVIGGRYGGYFGMGGNWANLQNCHKIVVWSASDAARASANKAHAVGVGTGVYFFMGGPGVDPNYNGTTAEAYRWGRAQASRAVAEAAKLAVTYPVIWADIEIPGHAPDYTPAPDNGWNSVYTSPCSGVVRLSPVPASVDRADFNGFAAWVTGHSKYKVGVYSAPDIWASIFGTGKAASIPNTYEWTYESFTGSLSHHPDGWCLSGTSTCARFFGGVTSGSKYALMWQWSGGGGSDNGVGDFDQIDANRTP
jgi:hypothetical protein